MVKIWLVDLPYKSNYGWIKFWGDFVLPAHEQMHRGHSTPGWRTVRRYAESAHGSGQSAAFLRTVRQSTEWLILVILWWFAVTTFLYLNNCVLWFILDPTGHLGRSKRSLLPKLIKQVHPRGTETVMTQMMWIMLQTQATWQLHNHLVVLGMIHQRKMLRVLRMTSLILWG